MCVVGEIEGVLETQARAGCTYTVCTILPLSAYSQVVLSVKSICSLYVSNTVQDGRLQQTAPYLGKQPCVSLADLWHWEASMS